MTALKEAGHHVFIASGRSPFMVKPILEELEIESFISYNGQYVVFEGEVIYKNPLPEDAVARLLKQAAEGEHPVVFMAEDTMKTTVPGHPHVSEGIGSLKAPYPEVDETFIKEKKFISCFYSAAVMKKKHMPLFRSLIMSAGTNCQRMCFRKAVQKRKALKECLSGFRTA